MAHAVFSPSASDRWINCPASHLRSLALPPAPSSVYAERGTLLHTLAAIGVTQTLQAMDMETVRMGETLAPDERAAIGTYVKYVKLLRKGAALWRCEWQVTHSEELFGTIDFFAVVGKTLHVVDFKGGRGIKVEVIDNPQLLTYAMMVCGALHYDDDDSELLQVEEVVLHIVQPLFEGDAPVRRVSYTPAQIDHWRTQVLLAMDRAKQPDAPFNPGEHCRFCPVKPTCPALMGLAAQLPAPVEQGALTTAKLAEWLAKADVIETWIAALREHAHFLIEHKGTIPGWRLQDKRATRKWSDEEAVLVEAKAAKLHVTERRVLSPAQVEKKYRTIPVTLQPFVKQESSGKNLVRDASYVAPESVAEQPALDNALLNLQYRV